MSLVLPAVQTINNGTSTYGDLKTNFDVLISNQILLRDYICNFENTFCDLATLITTDKTCLVNAINEIKNLVDGIGGGNTSVVTDNGDGTYTHSDGNGNLTTITTKAQTNPYNGGASGLTATNVKAAIDELAASIVSLPADSNGVLTNDGTGTITWVPAPNHYLTSTNGGSAPAGTIALRSTMLDDSGDGSLYVYTNDGSTNVWMQISA